MSDNTKDPGPTSTSASPRQRLLDELLPAEAVDVFGVVHAQGIVASRSKDADDWTFSLTLEAWKYRDGVIQNRELRLLKFVAEWESHFLRGRVEPCDIIHVRAKVADNPAAGAQRGLLVGIIGKHVGDEGLNRRAQELHPDTIVDGRFGVFTFDRSINRYEAEVLWGAVQIRLTLSRDGGGNIQRVLSVARTLWDTQAIWDQRIPDYAVSELLSLKNASWLSDDEHEVTTEDFKSRMTLQLIRVAPDGGFEFCYDDGDIFCGHSIMVSGNLTDGPTDAGIYG